MTRRRPPPQSWARPAQDGERRINVILNHKATVLFPKRHNVTDHCLCCYSDGNNQYKNFNKSSKIFTTVD
jgi:hypothetical protein